MNTNHTTRTAVRASVLTAVLTGLLLGAPAMAFADTSSIVNLPPNHSTGWGSIVGQPERPLCGTRIPWQYTAPNAPCFGLIH